VNTHKTTCYECSGEVNPTATACSSCGAPLPFGSQPPETFHVAKNGKRFGPYTEADARHQLAQGKIRPDDLCWQPGMATWLPVSNVLKPRPASEATPQQSRAALKKALWRACCMVALFIGIGSCSGSGAISNGLVSSYRTCADGWPSQSIGRQGACSHHGGVVTRKVDRRTDTQRYTCYALNAAGIIGLISALFLWAGGPPETEPYTPRSFSATPPVGTPQCPRCSRHMIRRRARRGRHAGQFFWGCSAYPSCRGTRPLR
jgi:ssDNA-binding Zn-finger/Zn-ribbon topoisomerase 1